MIQPFAGHHSQQSILEFGRRPDPINPFKIQLGVGKVCIRPAGLDLLPRQLSHHIDGTFELVIDDGLKVRVIADDIGDVIEGVLDLACLVQFQKGLPVFLVKFLIELCLGKTHTLLGKLDFYTLILHGKFLHRFEGRQLCRVGVHIRTGIQRAKLMDTDYIKSIHQLATGRVRGMVAVGELVLIENNASLGVSRNVVVTPRHCTVLIHIGDKGVDGIGYRISTAECSYRSRLLQRVSLFLNVTLDNALLPLGHGPLGGIVPVSVFCQHLVWIQRLSFHFSEYELTVRRSRGPVHQTARLIGRIVKQFNADLVRHFSGYRTVFIWGHLTGQRDDQAESRLLRRVFMGAVEQAMEGKEHLDLFNDVWGGVVHIQRKTRAGQHTVLLTATAFEGTQNEAAHILDVILLRLTQLAVLLHGFGGTLGLGDAVTELGKFHLHRIPFLVHTGITNTEFQLHFDTSNRQIWQSSSMFRLVRCFSFAALRAKEVYLLTSIFFSLSIASLLYDSS